MKGKRIPWEQRAEILRLLSHSVLVQVPYSWQPVVGAGVGLCGHNCVAAGAGAQWAIPCAGCLCSSRGVPGWWPVPTVCVTIAWLLAEERAGTAIPLPFKPTHCWFSMLEVGLFLPGPQTRSVWASHCGILITHTLFPVKLHVVLPSHMLRSEQGKSPNITCPGGWFWLKLRTSFCNLLLCGCGYSEERAASTKLRTKGQ